MAIWDLATIVSNIAKGAEKSLLIDWVNQKILRFSAPNIN
jgi:hypothetical protein